MKSQFLLGALLAVAVAASAQPAKNAPMLVNNLPFPLVSPQKAQQMSQKKISLHLRNATLLEALQSLQKQSGVRFDSGELVARNVFARKLSLDLETSSFSRAFDAILKAAKTEGNLKRTETGGNLAWNLQFGHFAAPTDMIQSGVGAFQIQLLGITQMATKTVLAGKNRAFTRAQDQSTTLMLDVAPDAGLRTVGSPHIRLTRVVDDTGRSLLTGQKDAPFRFGLGRDRSQSVRLKSPANGAKKLARVEGVAVFVVASKTERWELPNILAAKEASHTFGSGAGKTVVTLHGAQRVERNVKLDISLVTSAQENIFSVRAPLASSEVFLSALAVKRDDGQTVNSLGYSASGVNHGLNVSASFYLGSEAPPFTAASDAALTLVLDAPTEMVQTEVPFAFKDVPLP